MFLCQPSTVISRKNRVINTIWAFRHTTDTKLTGFFTVSALALFIAVIVSPVWSPQQMFFASLFCAVAFVSFTPTSTKFDVEALQRRFPQWLLRSWLNNSTKGESPYAGIAAKHESLSPDTIAWAMEQQPTFYAQLIGHENTPVSALRAAWSDNTAWPCDPVIARTITTHPNMTLPVLRELLQDVLATGDTQQLPHFAVSSLLTANDIRFLHEVAVSDPTNRSQHTVLLFLSRHTNTPTDILDQLALHKSGDVREGVVTNPNASKRAKTLATITLSTTSNVK